MSRILLIIPSINTDHLQKVIHHLRLKKRKLKLRLKVPQLNFNAANHTYIGSAMNVDCKSAKTTSSTVKRLTSDNICYDAIDMILCYLEVDDLANVADTSKRLREIAGLVFERKYANSHVVYIDEPVIIGETNSTDKDFTIRFKTKIKEFKSKPVVSCRHHSDWLKFFRNFGKFIKFIRIETERVEDGFFVPWNPWKRVNDYISEYCRDSLEILEMNRNPSLFLHKPMTKLHTFCEFRLHKYNNDREERTLALMPNLQTLLRNLSLSPADERHIPHLKDLTVRIENAKDAAIFRNFLKLNRQISKLTVETCPQYHDSVLISICENLLQLKDLNVILSECMPTITGPYRFETVEKFSVYVDLARTGSDLTNKNFSSYHFKALKELTMYDFNYDETFLQNALRNNALRKLKWRLARNVQRVDKIFQTVEESKSLQEINVSVIAEDSQLDTLNYPECVWKMIRSDDRNEGRTLKKIKFQRLK